MVVTRLFCLRATEGLDNATSKQDPHWRMLAPQAKMIILGFLKLSLTTLISKIPIATRKMKVGKKQRSKDKNESTVRAEGDHEWSFFKKYNQITILRPVFIDVEGHYLFLVLIGRAVGSTTVDWLCFHFHHKQDNTMFKLINIYTMDEQKQKEVQNSRFMKPSISSLTCPSCQQIFLKPVTLNCGHTFCKMCLEKQVNGATKFADKEMQVKKNKVPICRKCESIIWRPLSEMNENKTINSLIERCYFAEIKERREKEGIANKDSSNQKERMDEEINSEVIMNKILIRVEEPSCIPMPNCYSEILFSSHFIEDITDQSKEIVITWGKLEDLNMGLLGSFRKIDSLSHKSQVSKILLSTEGITLPQQKYKALFLGHHYVTLQEQGTVSINVRKKFIVLEQSIESLLLDLEICDCKIFHSKNSQSSSIEEFGNFFRFYDQLNNPHFMRQISNLIADQPFQSRENKEAMIYCMLKVLKMSNDVRKKIVYKFDDAERMEMINQWIFQNRNGFLDEIFNVKVPGKYPGGAVFILIVLLFALHCLKGP